MSIFWPFTGGSEIKSKVLIIQREVDNLLEENRQLTAENSELRRQLQLANDLLDTARKRASEAADAATSAFDILQDWVASR